MANPFETVILKLRDMGFFSFLLPYMLMAAIFYGALRKSQIFGDPDRNVFVNGIIALVAAFMVIAYPIIVGVDIETGLATFFFHTLVTTIVVVVILIVAGMFMPPNLSEQLATHLKGKSAAIALIMGLIVGGALIVSSGLINVLFPDFSLGGFGGLGSISFELSDDLVAAAFAAVLMIGSIFAIIYAGRGSAGNSGTSGSTQKPS